MKEERKKMENRKDLWYFVDDTGILFVITAVILLTLAYTCISC